MFRRGTLRNGVVEAQQSAGPRGNAFVLQGLIFLGLGVALAYFGYIWGAITLNPNELLGPVLFWYAVVALLLAYPLREATRSFASYIRRPLGAGVFTAYLATHLVLYGFVLEAILSTIYGNGALAVSPAFFVTTNVFSPPSLLSALFDVLYNPSIVLSAPPIFSAALSLYSISVAIVIDALVVASIGRTKEIGEFCTNRKKARSFVVLPALGIVFGASCCLSVAGLISLAVPSASVLTSAIWLYYFIFFFFPFIAGVLLYANFRSIEKISARLRSSLSNQN